MGLVRYSEAAWPGLITAYELGNEPNLYAANFGFVLLPHQLVEDLHALRAMLRRDSPSSPQIVGPDLALQLVPGVLQELPPSLEGFIKAGGTEAVDVVSYHWYPLDGLEAGRRLDPLYSTVDRAASLRTLERGAAVAATVRRLVGEQTPIWTGETALASFGGQAETSQTWAGVAFWADAIGQAAMQGQAGIVRQTLCGARYGLLDPQRGCRFANPDYWVTLLWKRLMGRRVMAANSQAPSLRAYAHSCVGEEANQLCLMVINTANATGQVHLEAATVGKHSGIGAFVLSSAGDVQSQRTRLNGVEIAVGTGGLPPLRPVAVAAGGQIALPPHAVAFLVVK